MNPETTPPTPELGSGAKPKTSSSDRRHGALVLGLAFCAAVGISWHSKRQSEPVFSQEPAPPSTERLVGFPTQVDVLENLARARELTPRDRLVGIEAVGVGSSGGVNVDAPRSRITYSFQSAQGEGPVPRRPPGTLARKRYCGRQAVEIDRAGIAARGDQAGLDCESALVELPTPACGPQQIWQLAKAKGVRDEHLATLRYAERDGTPLWHFQSATAQVNFSVKADCQTVLEESGP